MSRRDVASESENGNRFSNRLAVLLVLASLIYSFLHVMTRDRDDLEAGAETLSIAHWQLEPGVRDGFEDMAAKYNRARIERGEKPIVFKQLPISEKGYGQWVTTQLMGGTPPDLIEMGNALPQSVWVNYRTRYFLPISRDIMEPNRFNKGTQFENTPWKDTYIDGMGAPIWELQEYYEAGLSVFGERIFYNRDLLRKLTAQLNARGRWPAVEDAPPQNLRQFLELCDRIAELKDDSGQPYFPIAGSKYTYIRFMDKIVDPLSVSVRDIVDTNYDGVCSAEETFLAAAERRLNFGDPKIARITTIAREIARRFQSGWRGLSRDDAVMLFVQQRALFLSTGSWDAMTLKRQTEKLDMPFAMEIANFPLIARDDPEWSDMAWGRPYERCSMAFAFGVTKTSRHPQVALDFLRFLTTPANNEEFNRKIGWIPAIKTAQPSEFLKAFAPTLIGPQASWSLELGAQTSVIKDQLFTQALLAENGFSVKDWSDKMNSAWVNAGFGDIEQRCNEERENLKTREALAAVFRARSMTALTAEQSTYVQRQYQRVTALAMDSPRKILNWEKRTKAAREKDDAAK